MTIDEFIELLKNGRYLTIREEKQIAKWLEELKVIKEIDLSIPQHFTKEQSDWIKKYCINRNTELYNKAIDDAKSVILQTLDNKILVDTLHLRLEQLREGVTSGTDNK